MTTTQPSHLDDPPDLVPVDERRWRRVRWVALALLAASVGAAFALGIHPATYDDLLTGLRGGRVERVSVYDAMGGPDGLTHGESGRATVALRWREGPFVREARVLQVTADVDRDRVDPGDTSDTSATVVGRIDVPLRAARPGVPISWRTAPGSGVSVGPWRLDGLWWGLGPAGATMLALVHLASGPEPALATRPAWPVLAVVGWGVPLYLLLGASPRLRAVGPRRRLTGWWALLVAVVAVPVTEAAAAALARSVGW